MTVPEQTPYQEYTANGVATSFAVAFQCLSKDTLIVTINGVEQSSALWNFTGGNVVFIAAPANLSIVGIKRSTALSREITYLTHDNSFRPSVLNGDIDRLWHVLQENQLIYDKKVDKDAQIQTLGNLQGGGAIGLGLTLSLKDQTVTADYQFGSSIKIPVITLNQDGTVKSLHEVDVMGSAGGAFQINWTNVLNKPTMLAGYGITNAYTKTEANAAFIKEEARGNAFGVAELNGSGLLWTSNLPAATSAAIGAVKLNNTLTSTATDAAVTTAQAKILADRDFGIGQTWQDVKASRNAGTTYTNSTNRPISVYVKCKSTSSGTVNLEAFATVGSVEVSSGSAYSANTNYFIALSFIVPPGATYSVTLVANVALDKWSELR